MIKALIFDCFGVLTVDRWRQFTESLPAGPVVEKARELNQRYDAGAIGLAEFARGVAAATGTPTSDIEKLVTHPEPMKNIELLEYIKRLKKNYKIGMISNVATNWINDYFLTESERALFDDTVFSFQVGTTKPDPRIYQIALDNLGVRAAEAVFIDDVERYAEAAEKVGMKAIVYHDFHQMKSELEKLLNRR